LADETDEEQAEKWRAELEKRRINPAPIDIGWFITGGLRAREIFALNSGGVFAAADAVNDRTRWLFVPRSILVGLQLLPFHSCRQEAVQAIRRQRTLREPDCCNAAAVCSSKKD